MRVKCFIIPFLLLILSCKSESNVADKRTYDLDHINIKEIKVHADQHAKSLLDQLGIVYSAHFPNASVNATYENDDAVMEAMLKDSIRLVVLMREPTLYEIDQLKILHQAKPLYYTFAYNAIALVKDDSNTNTVIDSLDLVSQLNQGKDVFVTTTEHVDLFQLLLKKLDIQGSKHPLKTVNTVDELQQYLKVNKDHIGILPFSLVSDQYDPEAQVLTKKFRWLGIQNSEKDTIYPSQSTIFTKEWPLVIPYSIMYCNLSSEDGVGFVKFIHTKPAMRLILKAGLIPFTMPDRDIKIEPQSFNL
ncbi:MAG TPA: hypothetical protein VLZ75_08170 [Chitinophagales bacterium]|nr:hypothetical protein [Chitinophagales bacterium]